MTTDDSWQIGPATRVVLRCIIYYVVLLGGITLWWKLVPHDAGQAPASLDALFGGGPRPLGKHDVSTIPLDEATLALTVFVAMLAAVLLSLPVAWVYLVTRSKRGYQQSVVQLMIVLPAVVAGIVIMVKYSLALAFSLAGIVAAVRFRNTLEDSKDAVYVFLATGIGLASAVNLPVALVLSIGFNATVLALHYTDFGQAPVELDGRAADRRLKRARMLARTGTFVARMDDEVLRNMTREQLEGLAERAWRRAQSGGDAAHQLEELRLLVKTNDVAAMRSAIEPRLEEHTRQWRAGSVSTENGVHVVEYFVQLKKKAEADDLVALVRTAGSSRVLDAELV